MKTLSSAVQRVSLLPLIIVSLVVGLDCKAAFANARPVSQVDCNNFVIRFLGHMPITNKKTGAIISALMPSNLERLPFEFPSYGAKVTSPGIFRNLDNGPYVFMVNDRYELFMAPRYPKEATFQEEIIVTHRSLYESIIEERPDARIYSAGEFHIESGKISRVTNKSESWFGDDRHLQLAMNILKDKGAIFSRNVKVANLARFLAPSETVRLFEPNIHKNNLFTY